MAGRLNWEMNITDRLPLSCVSFLILIGTCVRGIMSKSRRELMAPGKVDRESKLQLGVFISRTLWSWPSCIEEVAPAVSAQALHTYK
jgi:hypothetical protein